MVWIALLMPDWLLVRSIVLATTWKLTYSWPLVGLPRHEVFGPRTVDQHPERERQE